MHISLIYNRNQLLVRLRLYTLESKMSSVVRHSRPNTMQWLKNPGKCLHDFSQSALSLMPESIPQALTILLSVTSTRQRPQHVARNDNTAYEKGSVSIRVSRVSARRKQWKSPTSRHWTSNGVTVTDIGGSRRGPPSEPRKSPKYRLRFISLFRRFSVFLVVLVKNSVRSALKHFFDIPTCFGAAFHVATCSYRLGDWNSLERNINYNFRGD